MTYYTVFLVLLLCAGGIAQSASYEQIITYQIIGDILETSQDSSLSDCEASCTAQGNACIGLTFANDECVLYTMMRNVIINPVYVKTPQTVTLYGSLNATEQLIANDVYINGDSCPYGWTLECGSCILQIDEANCDLYASFLGATYQSPNCVLPLLTSSYGCPNSSYILGQYPDGNFCHTVIHNPLYGTGVTPTSTQANAYCQQQTGGLFASIHSNEEMNVYISLQEQLNVNLDGVGIGLIAPSGQVQTISDLKWMDGTPITYTNWWTGVEPNTNFEVTIMITSGQWRTGVAPNVLHLVYKGIACKSNATLSHVLNV